MALIVIQRMIGSNGVLKMPSKMTCQIGTNYRCKTNSTVVESTAVAFHNGIIYRCNFKTCAITVAITAVASIFRVQSGTRDYTPT